MPKSMPMTLPAWHAPPRGRGRVVCARCPHMLPERRVRRVPVRHRAHAAPRATYTHAAKRCTAPRHALPTHARAGARRHARCAAGRLRTRYDAHGAALRRAPPTRARAQAHANKRTPPHTLSAACRRAQGARAPRAARRTQHARARAPPANHAPSAGRSRAARRTRVRARRPADAVRMPRALAVRVACARARAACERKRTPMCALHAPASHALARPRSPDKVYL